MTIALQQRRNGQNIYIYPDPTNASRQPNDPYFEERRQNFGGERASRSPPQDLNPRAPPFFAPAKRASETSRQETEHKRRASYQTEGVPRVVSDERKARQSSAARRASKSASASHARRSSTHSLRAPRSHVAHHASSSHTHPENLQEQLARNPLLARPQPVNVPEWTTNNAYHPGVGQVQARLPQRAGPDNNATVVGTSLELRAWDVNEPFPCPVGDCTSRHQPFMKKGQLTKHMKSHESNDKLPHRCEECGHCFRCPRELRRHRQTHQSNIDPKDLFHCPTCSASFPRSDNLKRHVRNAHPEPATGFGLVTPPRTAASTTLTLDRTHFPPLPPPPPTPPRSVDR